MTFEVTDELVEAAYEIVDGWYQTGQIDWEDVWDRLERQIDDLDLGTDLGSPELKELKRRVLKMRKEGQ
ncbi:hypothetical protein [Nonomuraea typhae]|uniref:CopG family transcriptional regulator n=1 Tax=Nonomuraea typhae TaxID=2603600 RepID=A0ABW7YJC1_9ACTN